MSGRVRPGLGRPPGLGHRPHRKPRCVRPVLPGLLASVVEAVRAPARNELVSRRADLIRFASCRITPSTADVSAAGGYVRFHSRNWRRTAFPVAIHDDGSWKTKRIKNTPRVTIAKSGALGKPKSDEVEGVARVLPKSETRRVYNAVLKRYWYHARGSTRTRSCGAESTRSTSGWKSSPPASDDTNV